MDTRKSGKRYGYYVSKRLMDGELDDGTSWRLPSKQIERHVVGKLAALLEDQGALINALNLEDPTGSDLNILSENAKALHLKLMNPNPDTVRAVLIEAVEKVTLQKDMLIIRIRTSVLKETHTDSVITLEYPLQQKRRGVETRLIIGGRAQNVPDTKLITAIAKARHWYGQLKSGARKSVLEIAKAEAMDAGDVSRALPLAFLATDIVRAILNGEQPVEMTVDSLRRRTANLPADWKAQQAYLGFTK